MLATAQNKDDEIQTVLKKGDEKMAHGGYGGISFGYNMIDGEAGMRIGGRAGYVMNHRLVIGFAGYGIFNGINKSSNPAPSDYSIAGGYGGLFIEPVIWHAKPVHITIPILFGGGGAGTMQDLWYNDYYYYNYNDYNGDAFLVIEPGL